MTHISKPCRKLTASNSCDWMYSSMSCKPVTITLWNNKTEYKYWITRMWANSQPDGHPAEYRWCPVLNAAKIGSWPLLDCRAVTLRIGERRLGGCKVNFAPGKIPLRSNSCRKCLYSLPARVKAKHCAKFGWLSFSDVAAVTKPRRESHWN